ncbi:MAG: cache domain-containing sensor histidine kinase [Ruminiclostridium sp.]
MISKIKRKKKDSITLSMLLIVLISLLVFTLLGICTFYFISIYRNSLYQAVTMNSEQAVSQATNTIENYSYGIKQDLQFATKKVEVCKSWEENRDFFNLMVAMRSDVVAIMLYDKDGNILNYGSKGEVLKEDVRNNLSFDGELFANGDYCITAPHAQNLFLNYYPWVVTVAQKVQMDLYEEEVYLAMDIKFSSIAAYVDNVGIGQQGYCYVMDSNGAIVYHPQQQMIYSGLKQENLNTISSLEDGVHKVGDIIYSIQTLEDGNWRVIGVSYTNELIASKINDVLRLIAINAGICMVVAVAIIIVIARRVSKPIKELGDAMKSFERDAENYRYQSVNGIYEVQTLSSSFEHMVIIIQELMDKVKQEEITLRKTELKALQAQINPHFLYNTLDSIQWMCEQGEMEKAVKMVSALAKLFRISISKGRELISIEDEINHAKNYLIIQSFRYKNQFKYRFEVDENILSYCCNKITLQPIIENAIYHGIDRMVDEGEIVIRAMQEGDDIVFTVSDNGVGMTEEIICKILKHDIADNHGIGIKNVNDRIKIYFGNNYGLYVESELDKGTKIIIKFPKIN